MRKFRELLVGGDKGFTLIELLVVIAVLGILAGIAIPRLSGVSDKAIRTEAETFLGTVKLGLEMYYVENDNSYPANGADLTLDANLGQYIDNFDEVTDEWGLAYAYTNEDDFTVTMSYNDAAAGIDDVVLTKTANGYSVD
jgi:general secretion pathway protein G